jgi:hypothetical protein
MRGESKSVYIRAESVSVESDEGRTALVFVDEDSGVQLTVNIHDTDLDAFYDQVKARIGSYLRERDEARRTLPVAAYDAREAYDLSDPKHPDFHSVHADIWDMRDGE